jgi:hypothetical protein
VVTICGGSGGSGGGGGGESPAYDTETVTLTGAQKSAMEYYSQEGYGPINEFLATGKIAPDEISGISTAQANKYIKTMDGAFSKASMKENAVVHRGISKRVADHLLNEGMAAKGMTMTSKTYMSTSTSRAVADKFTKESGGMRYQMEVRLPRGTKAMSAKTFTAVHSEKEILVARNTKMKSLGVKTSGKTVTFVMEAIP